MNTTHPVIQHDLEYWAGVIERIGKAGVVVSIAYGQCGENGLLWSLQMMNLQTGDCLPMPIAAHSFKHACWLAKVEATQKGWI